MYDGTCENETISRDASSFAKATEDREDATREAWEGAAGEEGRRGVSGLERPVRQGKVRQMKRPLHFGKTGQARFPKMDARRSASVDTAAVPQRILWDSPPHDAQTTYYNMWARGATTAFI